MAAPDPTRTKDLARIHLAAKELGMDKDTYRDFLRGLTGKESAGDMSRSERWKVLQELARQGAASGHQGTYPGRPEPQGQGKDALIGKIEAHLTDAKRPWAYAHAMAKRMFQVDRVQWCDADQLRRIVSALEYDQRRREARA